MHLILLHGYLLQGTGSNIYVANIAKAWQGQGHAVTVVCQDYEAKALTFVDHHIGPGEKIPSDPPEPGSLRVIVPDINRLLPVYVFDHYEGFQVKTIPEMTVDECETHIEMTAAVLRGVVAQGCSHVLANHALFGPIIASRALTDTAIPSDGDDRSRHELLLRSGERYNQRAVDADLPAKWPRIESHEPIILYFGKFLPAKGVGEVLVTVPTVLSKIPSVRFIFVGFGSYREHLEGMLQVMLS